MKAAVLFSGGKDSTFAMYRAIAEGYEIECLLSLVSDNPESYMFHTANINFVEKQAEAMDIPLLLFQTKGQKEKELDDLKNAVKFAVEKHKIEAIVVGALASQYQYERVMKIAEELKINVFSPLWKIDAEQYMKDLIDAKFEVVISSISAEGLSREMLGKKIDNAMLGKLKEINKKTGVHIAGEGGEYETFALNGPVFKKKLKIVESDVEIENENTGKLVIKKVELVKK